MEVSLSPPLYTFANVFFDVAIMSCHSFRNHFVEATKAAACSPSPDWTIFCRLHAIQVVPPFSTATFPLTYDIVSHYLTVPAPQIQSIPVWRICCRYERATGKRARILAFEPHHHLPFSHACSRQVCMELTGWPHILTVFAMFEFKPTLQAFESNENLILVETGEDNNNKVYQI